MLASELKDIFRRELADAELPGNGDASDSLWSDADIYNYLDIAYRDFFYYTDYGLDSSTTEVTKLVLAADMPWVPLDPRIIKIKRATLRSDRRQVTPLKFEDIQPGFADRDYGLHFTNLWEESTGSPRFLVDNMQRDMVRVVPIPIEADTIDLTVVRFPLARITDGTETLEVSDLRYIYTILDCMKSYAYKKQDADVADPDLAENFKAEFFRKITQINNEVQRLRRPTGKIRYGGY